MSGSTKILTVSYGTFSCTLEGFDDPFGTMRGIAEYFRDLAADDRYFGAEPPTPDVEMLQRIAEKEVQRRVEARIGDAGVALTQVTDENAPKTSPQPVPPEPAEEESHEPAKTTTVDTEEEDFGTGPLTHDDEYLLSDEPEDVLAVDPDAVPAAEGPAETVAEKLRRIRAVVSRSIEQEQGSQEPSFSDDKALSANSPDETPLRERAKTETLRQISDDLADDDDIASDAASDTALARSEEESPETSRDVIGPDEWDREDDDLGRIEPSTGDTVARDQDDLDDDDFSESPSEDDGWGFDTEGLTTAAAQEDFEDELEEQDEDLSESVISRVLSTTSTAPEQPEKTAEVLTLDATSRKHGDQAPRKTSKPLQPIDDTAEDVGRLLAETDSKFNDDESVRRRRVISQMRAAVAATKADRLVSRRVTSRESEDASEQSRYRNDLSQAVREVSRPVPGKETDRRPSVAPLVLVSAQRVDEVEQAPEAGSANGPQDFADFAKTMGARDLPELLEAAAAYTSFVEGQPSFSRPEIMKRVARVDPTLQLSREDGLRSFGQLLRQGKFRKLERGQFTIAETTRFKPRERAAGE